MLTLPLYQVDAFTDRLFAGNPAAVVPLETWLPDATMQGIAAENNLSETAFLVRESPNRWQIRWFTPTIEVLLCGHATLASALVLREVLGETVERLTFATRSAGELIVGTDAEGRYAMRFPMRRASEEIPAETATGALGARPSEVVAFDAIGDASWVCLYESEATVRALSPDFRALAALPPRNVIATAPGDTADFVSRMFAPKAGIDEDPVTGSAHCSLVPFWSERLGRREFQARQISARGGDLHCLLDGTTVVVAGRGVLYLRGEIAVPESAAFSPASLSRSS